jgi:hypothetical protein
LIRQRAAGVGAQRSARQRHGAIAERGEIVERQRTSGDGPGRGRSERSRQRPRAGARLFEAREVLELGCCADAGHVERAIGRAAEPKNVGAAAHGHHVAGDDRTRVQLERIRAAGEGDGVAVVACVTVGVTRPATAADARRDGAATADGQAKPRTVDAVPAIAAVASDATSGRGIAAVASVSTRNRRVDRQRQVRAHDANAAVRAEATAVPARAAMSAAAGRDGGIDDCRSAGGIREHEAGPATAAVAAEDRA